MEPDGLTVCVLGRVYQQKGTHVKPEAGLGMGRAWANEVDRQKGGRPGKAGTSWRSIQAAWD